MKRRKLQFGLAALFVAMTVFGLALTWYRNYLHNEERFRFHSRYAGPAPSGANLKGKELTLFQECREALLAGDERRIEKLALGAQHGQLEEIGYVPIQLATLDKIITQLKEEAASGEEQR